MTSGPQVWTVLVAAGSGSRFGGDKLAAVVEPPSTTVLDLAVGVAASVSHGVVVVHPAGVTESIGSSAGRDTPRFVDGGSTRSESVRRGLAAVPDEADVIVVHDAARPLADAELYRRVIEAVLGGADAAIPVVELVDTIRSLDGGTVDREALRAVQTPQAFRADAVAGDVRNLKITRPGDLDLVRALLANESPSDDTETR
jgi:2-C-methyl-D-erythritol 4-phosphate cytidylyltransferase